MTPTPAQASTSARKAVAVETPASTGVRSLSIPRDSRGHFQTEGRIDGQRIGFMVDTGASVIALNESSAARFGLRPSRGDYNSAGSSCATSRPWCCPTRRCRKTCSACRSCRDSSVSNTPMARWCWSSKALSLPVRLPRARHRGNAVSSARPLLSIPDTFSLLWRRAAFPIKFLAVQKRFA